MFNKSFFCKNRGGVILLLLFAVVFQPARDISAQDICLDASCNRLRVEVLRETTPTSSCNAFSAENCAFDRFNQVAYTVYLRHDRFIPSGDPLVPYNLEYEMLDVTLNLNNTAFSHIDVAATQACFVSGLGAKWQLNPTPPTGNKAVLEATDKSITISFANLEPGSPDCGVQLPNGTGNVIKLSYTDVPSALVEDCPPGRQCAYAKLFTVIVNAYPGENIFFTFGQKRYVSSLTGECNITSSGMNPAGRNGLFPMAASVVNPQHYTGTANEQIFAQFGAQVQTGDVREVPINLTNLGNAPVTISYLEFVIGATTTNIQLPFEFDLATPRVSTTGGGSGPVINNLHYVVVPPNGGITIGQGATMTIGKIKFSVPGLSNLGASAVFSFVNSGAAPSSSRIKTGLSPNTVCTSLNASATNSTYSKNGDAPCVNPNNIHFKVEGVGLDCGTSKVKVGLRTSAPPAIIRLSKVEFELEFDWSAPGISITGLTYTSWPDNFIDCATIGCYVPSGSGPKACWQVINNKTFKYCYETNDLNAPVFNLNDLNEMEILVNTPANSCIESVKLKTLRITYVGSNYTACIPIIDQPTGFPLCGAMGTMLTGSIKREDQVAIEAVSVALSGADFDAINDPLWIPGCPDVSCSSPCSASDLTGVDGLYQFSCTACTTCNKVKVVPTKNDNPLNGVTTYDLVLISKHILALEPLNSPYKMIAADVDKSGSITTFDIVETRKLILGIYNSFPNNSSWRFVDKAFVFTNPNNPFPPSPRFPLATTCLNFPSSNNDFVAIKVGDVNNSATGNRPGQRPVLELSWPNMRRHTGDVLSIPIRYSGAEPIEAIQLGLRFDPAALELIGPSLGDLETYQAGNFNLLQATNGEIRTLWYPMTDAEMLIQPGSILFNLTFKVLSGGTEGALPLWLDPQLLDGAAWKPNGEECSLQQTAPAARRDDTAPLVASGLTATIQPNPASGGVTLSVSAEKADKCRVAVFDAFGQMLFFREFELREGRQELALPEVAPLPAGVYSWKVYTPSLEAQGQLIKQ
jgi:hypothetical protein